MNIAIIVENLHATGGVERRTCELASGLFSAGHEVHVYANRWDLSVVEGVTFHRVPMLKIDGAVKPLSFACFSALALCGSGHDLVHTQARVFRYDVSTLGVGCHRAFLDALKIDPSSARDGRFHRVMLYLERAMLQPGRYRHIIVNSGMCKGELVNYYRVPPEDITVAHNGVDPETFSPEARCLLRDEARAQLGLLPDDLAVLYVGAGFQRKGLDTLVRALGALSANVKLLIVGKGSREEYDRLAAEHGVSDRITWIGQSQNIVRHYAAADIFALPTRYDPFANSTMEALACGLPVVTTTSNGVSEILSDGESAFIIPPGDHGALAERLESLKDENLRAQIGGAGRSEVEPYTWRRTTESTMRVYEEALRVKRT